MVGERYEAGADADESGEPGLDEPDGHGADGSETDGSETADGFDVSVADTNSGESDGGPDAGDDGGAGNTLICDDGNPCTLDRISQGRCENTAVEDGHPCDDGDYCTLGDRCRAGMCVPATRSVGPAKVLGKVDSMGLGGVVQLAQGRLLFYESADYNTRLILADLKGKTLQILDQVPWDRFVFNNNLPQAWVTALGDGLVAFANHYTSKVSLVSTTGDRIALKGTVSFGDESTLLGWTSFARHGDDLWVCADGNTGFLTFSFISRLDISDLDHPKENGSMVLSKPCGSIAVNAAGSRVYFSTAAGNRWIDAKDLDMGGAPTLGPVFSAPAAISFVDPFLVLQERERVRFLRESDQVEVRSVDIPGVNGAKLIDNGLVVQGDRPAAGGGAESFVALYDVFGPNGPMLSDEVVVKQASSASRAYVPMIAEDDFVMHSETRRIFRIQSGKLTEVYVPELGDSSRIVGMGSKIDVLDRSHIRRVDVSDPGTPAFTAKYPLPADALKGTSGLQSVLYEAPVPAKLFFGYENTSFGRITKWNGSDWPFHVERWRLDQASRLTVAGSFDLPVEKTSGELMVAGDYLYCLEQPDRSLGTIDMRLQRWRIDALPTSAAKPPTPDMDFLLSPSGIPPDRSDAAWGNFDVDPRARLALVFASSGIGDKRRIMFIVDLSTNPPTVRDHVEGERSVFAGRISGARAVLLQRGTGRDPDLVYWEVGKGEVARVAMAYDSVILLAFDGNTAYLWTEDLETGTKRLLTVPYGATLDSVSTTILPMHAEPKSIAWTDTSMAIGSETEIVVLRPDCRQ